MACKSWIQHPITGKLIPRDEYVRPNKHRGAYVQGDIEAFVSPIDGSVIDDRGKLRRHNKEHGVTNSRDYSAQYLKDRKTSREAEGERQLKVSRLNDLQSAIAKHGG